MTVKEAKKQAEKGGSVELTRGVYLMTGKEVLAEAEPYFKEVDTDEVASGYKVSDISDDQLYIQINGGYFYEADDDDISAVIGIKLAAATLGRKGGSSKSPAKILAARENGKKGGRPKGKKL